jgi:acyl-CoA thioester hydrolase
LIFSETQIRVRYADTDQMKTAYYAKFFEYFEQGRSDLLREAGLPYPEIESMGYILPVIEAHADYYKPARYDDLLIVKTILKEAPQVRIRIEYEVFNAATKEMLAAGHTVHPFVRGSDRRPSRAPARFLEILELAFARNAGDKKFDRG